MFAIQGVARRAPQLSKIIVNQHRTLLDMTIVGVPPREKVSLIEVIAHGAALWTGIMAIPMYIACNVKNYSKQKGD